MKVKITNASSEHAKHRIGQERYINFVGNKMVMEYTDGSGKLATTSRIKNIKVETQNTTYELEVVDD